VNMMINIYQIGTDGYWTGATKEVAENAGIKRGWTRYPVPPLSSGQYAAWAGNGWAVVDNLPAAPPELTVEERMTEAAQECSRRIYAIADETAQMNMASMASAGLMPADQLDSWKQALFWVVQMRGTWRGLASDTTKVITDNVNWPECPTAAAALAKGF
jgi:hypothetical protein